MSDTMSGLIMVCEDCLTTSVYEGPRAVSVPAALADGWTWMEDGAIVCGACAS
jgi:hypothetical protein